MNKVAMVRRYELAWSGADPRLLGGRGASCNPVMSVAELRSGARCPSVASGSVAEVRAACGVRRVRVVVDGSGDRGGRGAARGCGRGSLELPRLDSRHVPEVAAGLRRCVVATFGAELHGPGMPRTGPVVLVLSSDLVVRDQTPETERFSEPSCRRSRALLRFLRARTTWRTSCLRTSEASARTHRLHACTCEATSGDPAGCTDRR